MSRRPKPTVLHRLHGTYNVTDHRNRAYEPLPVGSLERKPPNGLTRCSLAPPNDGMVIIRVHHQGLAAGSNKARIN